VCLHYWLNRLQPLPFAQAVFVSLNPIRPIRPECVMQTFDYEHPVFDLGAIQAQTQMPRIQGQSRTWYAGAWMGYGFHEDGLRAGQAVVRDWRARRALAPIQVGA
jgi:predicted NAD/FAD-binding protein